MKRKAYLAISGVCLPLIAGVGLAFAQTLLNCKQITFCSATPSNNGCNISYTFKKCDNSPLASNTGCNNKPCSEGGGVSDCSCSCEGSSPNYTATVITWSDCNNTLHSNRRECSGNCPAPCPTPTSTPPAQNCTWIQSWCTWACSFEECQELEMYWNFASNTCEPDPPGGECETQNCCEGQQECCTWDSSTCSCNCSPILVDVSGNGFSLTSAAEGVSFDVNIDGVAGRIGWTKAGSDDAFLVLDRNANRSIDDGSELFGGLTPQRASTHPNGFEALAEYDKPHNGGNNDGWISSNDAVFSSLRLWQDINHNGLSEPAELHSLNDLGVNSLELNYKEAKGVDQFGNIFRYRGKVKDRHGAQIGRWAWDVFLVHAP